MSDSIHVVDLLPAYVNSTLDPAGRARVDRHLRGCAACAAELESWRLVAGATREATLTVAPPSIDVLRGIHAAIDAAERLPVAAQTPSHRSIGYLWQLLLGQLPLVRRGIWVASALTTSLGVLVAFLTTHQSIGSTVLALVAPVVAAIGIAFIYGPENDPSLEIAVSTPTSPRMVLLSRMTLVFGYDLLLALAASVTLSAIHGMSLWQLINLWFGPMLFLSALALTMSLLFSPVVAMTAALVPWGVRLFILSRDMSAAPVPRTAQQTLALPSLSPFLLVLGLALLLFAIVYVPRQERFPLGGQTPWQS